MSLRGRQVVTAVPPPLLPTTTSVTPTPVPISQSTPVPISVVSTPQPTTASDHFFDESSAGINNKIWVGIIAGLLVLIIVVWCCLKVRKEKRIRRRTHEEFQSEVQQRLSALDDGVMTQVTTDIKKALPRPTTIRPVRQSAMNRGSSAQNRDAVSAQDLGDELAGIFALEIWGSGDSVADLRLKLISFMESHILPYIQVVVQHTYKGLDSVLKREGEELFRGDSFRTLHEGLTKRGEKEGTCGWRMCCCICPGRVQSEADRQRAGLYYTLQRRLLVAGGVELTSDPSASSRASVIAAPCIRRGWIPGASYSRHGRLILTFPKGCERVGGAKAVSWDEELGRLFASHYTVYRPPTLDSRLFGSSPSPSGTAVRIPPLEATPAAQVELGDVELLSPFSDLSPRPIKEKVFAVTTQQDRSIFSCPDNDTNTNLREDIHLFMTLLKDTIFYSPGITKKLNFPMYDAVQCFDLEVKAWLRDVAAFLAEREASSWRVEFMRRAKLVVNSEEEGARQKIKETGAEVFPTTETPTTATTVRFDLSSTSGPQTPVTPEGVTAAAASGIVLNEEETDEEFQKKVLEELSAPFKASEQVLDPPEVRLECCGYCVPDMPAIRRSIPAGEEALSSQIKSVLKDLVLGKARTPEHVEIARRFLGPLRSQLLELLYPETQSWDATVPPGGSAFSGSDVSGEVHPMDQSAEAVRAGDVEIYSPRTPPPRSPTPEAGDAGSYFESFTDVINEKVLEMTQELEKTVSGAVDRRELSLALEVTQQDPVIGKQARRVAQNIYRKNEAWIRRVAHFVTVLKVVHRTARDICAMGRELRGGFSVTSEANLRELLHQQQDYMTELREDGPEFAIWLPFGDITRSHAHYTNLLQNRRPVEGVPVDVPPAPPPRR
jgi:hypothetical protein